METLEAGNKQSLLGINFNHSVSYFLRNYALIYKDLLTLREV